MSQTQTGHCPYKKRAVAIVAARASWNTAPQSIRMMAGNYVTPLLLALEAMGEELDVLRQKGGNDAA